MASDRTHHLKTHPRFWDHIAAGTRTFEVRRDDRGYCEGDVLVLHRWASKDDGDMCKNTTHCQPYEKHTERLVRRVTYVLPGGQYGIEPGFVVLGIEPMEEGARRG